MSAGRKYTELIRDLILGAIAVAIFILVDYALMWLIGLLYPGYEAYLRYVRLAGFFVGIFCYLWFLLTHLDRWTGDDQ